MARKSYDIAIDVLLGFIVVDLPPEEAVRFRNFCTKGGYVTLCLQSFFADVLDA